VPRTAARLLLAALASTAACTGEGAGDCPGVTAGAFRLRAVRTQASCQAGTPEAGFDALFPAAFELDAELSFAAEGSGAALCTGGRGADPLSGSHAGDQLTVALDTTGAVLAACDAACVASARQTVEGRLVRDPTSGAATGFTGTLTEAFTAVEGAPCGPCTTPCQATYQLGEAAP
jgi:hypothetical protein